ncbi:hypothetical protein [Caldicellulosiruptor danielii]|uniref:Uncharacterized protein n=1 Tax=Anaerocellum danielii TaxID=1387557 RepID=A0ABZ0U3G7_9FIRM|nr:hypothetical protein [Caldicellulosiruptor danielii]WPX09014.1 hypothetical protein SOJ16_000182 [Caldicellulosiruptor danielii]
MGKRFLIKLSKLSLLIVISIIQVILLSCVVYAQQGSKPLSIQQYITKYKNYPQPKHTIIVNAIDYVNFGRHYLEKA